MHWGHKNMVFKSWSHWNKSALFFYIRIDNVLERFSILCNLFFLTYKITCASFMKAWFWFITRSLTNSRTAGKWLDLAASESWYLWNENKNANHTEKGSVEGINTWEVVSIQHVSHCYCRSDHTSPTISQSFFISILHFKAYRNKLR